MAQAFLTSVALSALVMAPLGYLLSPSLLELVNATTEVRKEALPFLRTMFLFSFGMLTFFIDRRGAPLGRRRPHAASPRRRRSPRSTSGST